MPILTFTLVSLLDMAGVMYGLGKMASLIDSGQVSVNTHAAVDPAIPFGGNKMSGWGREFGEEGLDPYLKTKATTVLFSQPPM